MATASNSAKRPPETYTKEEIKAVFKTISHRAPTGVRNRALVAVGYRAGLRIAEALALYPKDINLDKGEIRVLHGKGDRARTVGIDPQACSMINLWLERRKALGFNGRQPLFCTLEGKQLKDAYVRAAFARIAKRAGIEKRLHYHALRHTFAKELVEEGKPLPYIQRILGHSSLQTTQVYLQSIAPQDIVNAVRGREWDFEV